MLLKLLFIEKNREKKWTEHIYCLACTCECQNTWNIIYTLRKDFDIFHLKLIQNNSNSENKKYVVRDLEMSN